MSFDHAWILLALLLPLGWAAWEWRVTGRRLALGLKAGAFVCIVLALSGPRVVGIIPARMKSSRFPGKPLAPLLGRPMIEHVFRRARMNPRFAEVCVATCDDEIARERKLQAASKRTPFDRGHEGLDRALHVELAQGARRTVNDECCGGNGRD